MQFVSGTTDAQYLPLGLSNRTKAVEWSRDKCRSRRSLLRGHYSAAHKGSSSSRRYVVPAVGVFITNQLPTSIERD